MSRKTSVDTIVKFGAGGMVLLLAAYSAVAYMLVEKPVPGCMESYERTAIFDLNASDGRPLTTIELQARAGAGEVGIMQNARIVEVGGGPSPVAMEVALSASAPGGQAESGLDFAWHPASDGARSACLRYSVWMPVNFDFGPGGYLPGFYGNEVGSSGATPSSAGLRVRTKWQREGTSEIHARAPAIQAANGRSFTTRDKVFGRGRWNTVEQELVVNAPGAQDGSLKVWVNGDLVVNERRLQLSKENPIEIEGVLASIGFVGQARVHPNPEAAKLQISPIVLAWR